LIDATTGAHLWVDRFDGALDDIFDLQDQVASSVAGAIEPRLRLSEIERAARKPGASLDTYDLYLRALAQTYRYTEESVAAGVVLLRQALAIDPFCSPAAALFSLCRWQQLVQGWGPLAADDIEAAIGLARQALDAARDDPDTLWRAALALFFLAGEAPRVEAVLNRALTLNPNAADAWQAKGWVDALNMRPEAAIEAFDRALRLSPFDPLAYFFAAGVAAAHLAARRFEQAIEWADRSLYNQPRVATARRVKIIALAHLGRLVEARAELGRLLAIDPRLTLSWYRAFLTPSCAPEFVELMITGLRLAGLPEE
jgi:adenylate cyclase